MSYDEALEALTNGDFRTAVLLLEKAAHETDYTSDKINHAYTVALYRSGDKSRLSEVSFRIGSSLVEHDRASALDYFQRALFAGLDPQRVREIGKCFESWAVPASTRPSSFGTGIDRVAHVVGCTLPGHPPAQYVKMLVTSLRLQGIESTVFTTEWAASWFFNSADVLQSQKMGMNAEVRIASVDGDFIQRAERIAQDIRASEIKVAFFHGGLMEQISALVATLRPASVQIGVNHGSEMDADLFDGNVYLFRNALQLTRPHPAEWIPLSSDIEARLQKSEPATRRSMGLEGATTISATFGNLQDVAGPGYLRVLVEIMNRFPTHFHVFAGSGNVRSIRSHLHSEGVLPRVRFMGDLSDVAPLLGIIDVYLASFPRTGDQPILEAMGAGKPVVVLRFPFDSATGSGPELVAARELIAPGEADYIEIADRLLRTPGFRADQGKAMLDRFRSEFRPARLGERYKAFLEKF